MASDIFGISVSALNSAQIGLSTTEHNIANANTAGFNRQEIVTNARAAQLTGSGFVGQGADVGSVKRVYDAYLSSQVTQQQGTAAQLNSYYSQIQQINNMLADPTAGLSPAMQDFFNAVNVVASSPESMPARQTMLSSAQSLSSRFQSLNQQLLSLNDGVNQQITTSVDSVNSYSQQIATLNQSIVLAQAASGGKPPNDLLDQRDQIITQLNQEIKTNVTKQGDGSYNVSVGNGQLLVVGSTSYSMVAVQSLTDPGKLEVASGTASGAIVRMQQSSIQGGNLGGLLAFRNQTLDATQNSLGLVAMGLAGTFNQQHQLGQDLKGVMANSANSFFTDPVPVVNKNAANTGTANVTATVSDYAKLTGSDYSLSYDGQNFTLTRFSDNSVTSYAKAVAPATSTTIDLTASDGLKLSIPNGANAGDSFIIRPTVNGALGLTVAITDPAKIAASTPVIANASLKNAGSGKISSGVIDASFTAATVNPAVTLTYSSTTNTLSGFPATLPVTVTNNGVATVFAAGTPVTYTDGATLSFGGASFTLGGTLANNDTFTVTANTNATTDNRNALLLAGLQTKNTLQGGTASYQGVYSQLVSQVGNKTRELQVTSTAQTTLVNQSIQAQQAVSGVNLDEEAANLLRYQRAYQAAGKAMQIASTLFDTLLQLGR
jgi:flagellar hook-associated protein 1 FlgK